MKRIHQLSGILLSIFVGFHLVNHLASVSGADTHIATMTTLRLFYRNPVGEVVLLTTVLIQIGSGIKLFNTNRKATFSNVDKLHRWSGIYLAIFFVIHISAVLAGRILLNLDTNFYFGVAGLNTFPFSLFFIPYYALAILAFFAHVASIHRKKMKNNVVGLSPKIQAYGILALGLVITIIIFYGATNHFKGVIIPKEYNLLLGM